NRGIREVDDFDCVIWNTAAKNLAKKTTQGSLVLVNGTLQKNKKNKLEILVEEFSVLEFKPIKTGQQLKEPPKIAEVN
ncbi:hypothetical protein EQ500_15020, partial [Lactobacillus sp. XV13L]|nr:hypothetical protein [Lactobacillus sp. XV13L]